MSYLCFCGHIIKDTVYPCPEAGDLKWQPEFENESQNAFQALKDFFAAVEAGERDNWIMTFFYPSQLISKTIGPDGEITTGTCDGWFHLKADMATIVSDIMSRFERQDGHSVFRCPECERLYIQKEYRSDEYSCYEKRPDYSRT